MSSSLKFLRIVAAAAALAAVALPVAAQEAPATGPSMDFDPEDFFPPVAAPREKAEPAQGERGSGNPYGASRRLDAYDRMEEEALRRSGATQPSADSGTGGIICIAGCDSPSDEPVVRKRRKPVASLTP